VDKNHARKAKEDYAKRTKTPNDATPSKTTYVCVTPRRWSQKDAWAKERIAERIWADASLNSWCEFQPGFEAVSVVHEQTWLARTLQIRPHEVVDLDGFFEEWAGVTSPPLTREVVLTGRADVAGRILDWLGNAPSPLFVQGETIDEVIAVVAAAARTTGNGASELQARGVVVESAEAWRDLVAHKLPLVLIPRFQIDTAISAVGAGHHVLVPQDRRVPPTAATLVMPDLAREELPRALAETMNIEERRAQRSAARANGSLGVLRRQLAAVPAAQTPPWSNSAHEATLCAVLLVDGWNSKIHGDREVVERIAGRPYDDVDAALVAAATLPECPIRQKGDAWEWVARDDAWTHLASRVPARHFEAFMQVVQSVLGTPLPKYDLPSEERYAAGIYGKASPQSDELREGLATTLALLAVRNDALAAATHARLRTVPEFLVRQILDRANDWRTWASLRSVLAILAEAAPDAFLSAFDAALARNTNWAALFEESGLWGSADHVGVLWALELLAWNPQYLSRVTLQLAQLTLLDPGGRLANRPLNSIAGILSGWFPQTTAPLPRRMAAVDGLVRRYPETGWKVLLDLVPKSGHAMASSNPSPRWRNWADDARLPGGGRAFRQHLTEVGRRLIDTAGSNGQRWATLVERAEDLDGQHATEIADYLNGNISSSWPGGGRIDLWDRLRNVLHRHRQFPDADWILPADILEKFECAYAACAPDDPVAMRKWIFDGWPKLPKPPTPPEGYDFETERAAIDELRQRAVTELFERGGPEALLSLAGVAEAPNEIGTAAVGAISDANVLSDLVDHGLGSDVAGHDRLALAVVASIAGSDRAKGIGFVVRLASERGWEDERKARAALALPLVDETWDAVHTWGAEVEEHYWHAVAPGPYAIAPQHLDRAMRELLSRGRPDAVLGFANSLYDHKTKKLHAQPELLLKTLEAFMEQPPSPGSRRVDPHALVGIFDGLADAKVDESRLARLEFLNLGLFDDRSNSKRILFRELGNDPTLFVAVLANVFRDGREERPEDRAIGDDPNRRMIVGQNYRLLRSWRGLPGADPAGIDAKKLLAWVEDVRRLCEANGRGAVGDSQIGQVLARAPHGADGNWPHEAVRDALEVFHTPEIMRGFAIGTRNRRGVVTRPIGEGGAQERALAAEYGRWADALSDPWPQTAGALRLISDEYLGDAAREDEEAKRNR